MDCSEKLPVRGGSPLQKSVKLLWCLLLACLIALTVCSAEFNPEPVPPPLPTVSEGPVPCGLEIYAPVDPCKVDKCVKMCQGKGYMDEGHECRVDMSNGMNYYCCIGEQQQELADREQAQQYQDDTGDDETPDAQDIPPWDFCQPSC